MYYLDIWITWNICMEYGVLHQSSKSADNHGLGSGFFIKYCIRSRNNLWIHTQISPRVFFLYISSISIKIEWKKIYPAIPLFVHPNIIETLLPSNCPTKITLRQWFQGQKFVKFKLDNKNNKKGDGFWKLKSSTSKSLWTFRRNPYKIKKDYNKKCSRHS